ncbi:MAG: DUF4388 domain-containing protein [Acidimicrobiales bacterium]
MMSTDETKSGTEQGASLIASLRAFPLQHILHVIIESDQSGELYVGGTDKDGRAWIEGGKVTGFSVDTLDSSTATAEKAVFELALLEDAWAYFTLGRFAPAATTGEDLRTIVDSIGPQLEEYHKLTRKLPLDAFVLLRQDAPAESVQMSSTQWHVLTRIGAKPQQIVRDILSATETSQVETLRTLDELLDASLIAVEAPQRSAENAQPSGNRLSGEPPSEGPSADEPASAESSVALSAAESKQDAGLQQETIAGSPSTPLPPTASPGVGADAQMETTGTDSAVASPLALSGQDEKPSSDSALPGSVPLGSANSSEPDRAVTNALRDTVDPLGGFILVTDSPARYESKAPAPVQAGTPQYDSDTRTPSQQISMPPAMEPSDQANGAIQPSSDTAFSQFPTGLGDAPQQQ